MNCVLYKTHSIIRNVCLVLKNSCELIIGKYDDSKEHDIVILNNGMKISILSLYKIIKEYAKEISEYIYNTPDLRSIYPGGEMILTNKGKDYLENTIYDLIYKKIADIDAESSKDLPFEKQNDNEPLPF